MTNETQISPANAARAARFDKNSSYVFEGTDTVYTPSHMTSKGMSFRWVDRAGKDRWILVRWAMLDRMFLLVDSVSDWRKQAAAYRARCLP